MTCSQSLALAAAFAFATALTLGPFAEPGHAQRVYHVDYEAGDDANDGLSTDAPLRHAPGDASAAGRAAEVELEPGDVVRFKGGVAYRGTIEVPASGRAGAPIVYDGNTDGAWGEGPAILDGSDLIEDWQPVSSADEALGHENWGSLYVGTMSGDIEPRMISLTQDGELFTLARDPAPADPFFMDDRSTMRNVNPPRPEDRGRAAIDTSRLFRNSAHPMTLMVDGRDNTLAIIDPMDGARLEFHIPAPRTVTRVRISTDTRSTRPRDIVLRADDEEILSTRLPNRRDDFDFELDEPVTLSTLTLEIESVYDGGARHGGMRRVQAFDAEGNDVLRVIERGGDEAYAAYADDTFFTQPRADHWYGSYFAIHAGSNFIYYRRVLDYFPDEHKIHTEPIEVSQYPEDRGLFAMLNVLPAIDGPGQFYVSPDVDDAGNRRIFAWPHGDDPAGIAASQRSSGFVVNGQDHVEIAGFLMEGHGGSGSFAVQTRDASHVTIRDNEIRLGRGGAIQAQRGEGILIKDNHAHHNRGRGFRLHTLTDSVVTGNRMHKNGSTSIGWYVCRDIEMSHNHITGHYGVHANAMTVYAESENVLIEGNRVWDNNNGLTMQDVTNVTVRNNIMHATGLVVGMWTGYHRNIRYEHNALIGPEHRPSSDYRAGLFTNGTVDRLHVHNNILAGTSGRLPGEYSHNLYTRIGPRDDADDLPQGSLHEPELRRIFLDPDNQAYELRPGSPAIDAGIDLGVERDIEGNARPQGAAPDIGPYEFQAE